MKINPQEIEILKRKKKCRKRDKNSRKRDKKCRKRNKNRLKGRGHKWKRGENRCKKRKNKLRWKSKDKDKEYFFKNYSKKKIKNRRKSNSV